MKVVNLYIETINVLVRNCCFLACIITCWVSWPDEDKQVAGEDGMKYEVGSSFGMC